MDANPDEVYRNSLMEIMLSVVDDLRKQGYTDEEITLALREFSESLGL